MPDKGQILCDRVKNPILTLVVIRRNVIASDVNMFVTSLQEYVRAGEQNLSVFPLFPIFAHIQLAVTQRHLLAMTQQQELKASLAEMDDKLHNIATNFLENTRDLKILVHNLQNLGYQFHETLKQKNSLFSFHYQTDKNVYLYVS